MILKHFRLPLILFGSAVLLWVFIFAVEPGRGLEGTPYEPIGRQIAWLDSLVLSFLLFAASLIGFYKLFQLWQWYCGKAPMCSNCGGIVEDRNGRYGPYVHCLACSKNESIR